MKRRYLFAYALIGIVIGLLTIYSCNKESNEVAEVETTGVSVLSSDSVEVTASVITDKGSPITEKGVVWNEAGEPTLNHNKLIQGAGTGPFKCFITGLLPETNYHVRAFATNQSGTAYGADIGFKTNPQLFAPEVVTISVIPTSPVSANVSANVITDNGTPVTERGIVWNETGNPTISDNKLTQGTGIGAFSCDISGLLPKTTYHARAYAINQAGTFYGSDLIFETPTSIISTILDQPIILRSIDSVRIVPDMFENCPADYYAYPNARTVAGLIDVDNDNIDDYKFHLIHENTYCEDYNYCAGNDSYILYVMMYGINDSCIFINKVYYNTYLFASSDTIIFKSSNTATHNGSIITGFCQGQSPTSIYNKYVGIVYKNMLGWIHIDRRNNYELVIRGWAINTIPFEPIIAGQTE